MEKIQSCIDGCRNGGVYDGRAGPWNLLVQRSRGEDGGEDVIRKMCTDFGINPDKAVISDLTTEQLIKIGEEAFETSDLAKG